MNTSRLTIEQLYTLSRNKAIEKSIRTLANNEIEVRNISVETRRQMEDNYETKLIKDYYPKGNIVIGLNTWHIVIQLILTFISFYSLISFIDSRLQGPAKRKARKQFIFFLLICYIMLPVLIVLWGKFYLTGK